MALRDQAKCKIGSVLHGGNYFQGDIFLHELAIFMGWSVLTPKSDVVLSERTFIDVGTTFTGRVKFGLDNIVGAGSEFKKSITFNNVQIGVMCSISGEVHDRVKIGHHCNVLDDTVIEEDAELEPYTDFGPGSYLVAGVKIGHHSCVGAGVFVYTDLPPYSYTNEIRYFTTAALGKIPRLVDGKCVEVNA